MDNFVNKDGKEVIKITDDGELFIDKELAKKSAKDFSDEELIEEFKRRFGKKDDATNKSQILSKDRKDNSNS